MSSNKDYTGYILRVRHAFRMDTHCEEVMAWDEERQKPVHFVNGQGSKYQKVDAPKEIVQKFFEWQDNENERIRGIEADWQKGVLEPGKTIKVVGSKRVKNLGAEGEIMSMYTTSIYNNTYTTIYFRTVTGEKLKTYASNVKILIDGEWKEWNLSMESSQISYGVGTY